MSDLNASLFKDHLCNLEAFIDAGRGQMSAVTVSEGAVFRIGDGRTG